MILDGCENPSGCRKIATVTLEATDGDDVERVNLCAYCAENARQATPDHVTITEV